MSSEEVEMSGEAKKTMCTLQYDRADGTGIFNIVFLLYFIEHTCAYAWWAHMHRFLSVRPPICDWTKFILDNNY